MSHTPTPWTLQPHCNYRDHDHEAFGIGNIDEGVIVADVWNDGSAREHGEANARLIVRAVNAFEPMRQALQGLLARHRDGSDESHWAEWDAAEEALALAEKEKP